MSNPNNPFLPLLTQENNNNNESRNQDNNETKDNNSHTLEEGSSVSAPPPAYEDVVKPGYNYQHTYNPLTNPPTNPSYPPPSYPPPPPTVPMTANVNQTNQQPHHPHANHDNKYGYRVCCCRFSSRGKACCYALIILIVFVILASISIANNSICRQLVLEETPQDFFVDPQQHTSINLIEGGSRIRTEEGVRILQNPSSDETRVNIQVFTGSTKNVSPQFQENTDDRGKYNLIISKKSGFNLFNIPPHCMIFRIDVYLPQNATIPSINTDNMNIRVMKSDTDKQYQNIPLITDDGDIELEAVNATSVDISTDNGNIIGLSSKIRVSNNLSVKTEDGDLNLSLDVTTNSTVSIQTKDGNVKLNVVRIDGSQVNCKVRTEDGGIRVNGRFPKNNNMFDGTFGTADDRSPANITITTNDGDVDLSINN